MTYLKKIKESKCRPFKAVSISPKQNIIRPFTIGLKIVLISFERNETNVNCKKCCFVNFILRVSSLRDLKYIFIVHQIRCASLTTFQTTASKVATACSTFAVPPCKSHLYCTVVPAAMGSGDSPSWFCFHWGRTWICFVFCTMLLSSDSVFWHSLFCSWDKLLRKKVLPWKFGVSENRQR